MSASDKVHYITYKRCYVLCAIRVICYFEVCVIITSASASNISFNASPNCTCFFRKVTVTRVNASRIPLHASMQATCWGWRDPPCNNNHNHNKIRTVTTTTTTATGIYKGCGRGVTLGPLYFPRHISITCRGVQKPPPPKRKCVRDWGCVSVC